VSGSNVSVGSGPVLQSVAGKNMGQIQERRAQAIRDDGTGVLRRWGRRGMFIQGKLLLVTIGYSLIDRRKTFLPTFSMLPE